MSETSGSAKEGGRGVDVRAAGTVGVAGGLLVVLWAGALAVVPADAVPERVVYLLAYVSTACLGYAAVGLFVAVAGRGDAGRLASVGVAGLVAGLVLLAAGGVAGVVAPSLALVFVGPGGVAALAGMVVLVATGHRAGVLPRWLAVVFVAAAALLALFRPGGPAAALAVPFGAAWVAVGMRLGRERAPAGGAAGGDSGAAADVGEADDDAGADEDDRDE